MSFDDLLQPILIMFIWWALDRWTVSPRRGWVGLALLAGGLASFFWTEMWRVFGHEIIMWKSSAVSLGLFLMMRSNRHVDRS
ncbi:hypothetical protein [Pseudomonas putida]|uniref:hypothetical protein n=1 Tax=Pseudomonas putida TaxID=303 RepID=UPI0008191453|nr:hypothetical protein [Pseudomonas putida]OCT25708.1 hypothetical protein A6E24_11420 [Pseudomonas putida]OCT27631.1 hypothetical protein A6E23_07855 [Pseudomonas putida]OCT32130.1 hypothetical protein A6E20_00645 [Pseudomonas putida]OCT38998.1 hypothetical protein A6E19_11850 [Pseudomonas putida]